MRHTEKMLLFSFALGQQCPTSTGPDGATTTARCKRTCSTCPWRCAEPAVSGKYTILRSFDSTQSMRTDWACYMGGTGVFGRQIEHIELSMC